jgi:hypothetical protein
MSAAELRAAIVLIKRSTKTELLQALGEDRRTTRRS